MHTALLTSQSCGFFQIPNQIAETDCTVVCCLSCPVQVDVFSFGIM
jgi:hypothetical protein